MKILKLQASNVKRLTAVDISPHGSAITISGKNAAGKSSVLDAIQLALGGTASLSEQVEPVRRGAAKAEITLDLGDLVVKRTIPAGGGRDRLVIENRDGATYKSPQTMLNSLLGKFTFDPLEFAGMPARQQLDVLKGLVGVDVASIEQNRQAAYSERTLVNREVDSLQAQVKALPFDAAAPAAEISVADLMAEIEAVTEQNRLREQAKRHVEALQVEADRAIQEGDRDLITIAKDREAIQAEIANGEAQIARWQKIIANRKASLEGLAASVEDVERISKANAKALRDEATAVVIPETVSLQPVQDRMRQAETVNAKVRLNRQHADMKAKLEAVQAKSQRLTDTIADLDKKKSDAIAAAKFPVDGLGFGADGPTFKDLPFSQCSQAERLRVSVAMGLALNPKLKVLLIRDASLLDQDSLRMVGEMAEAADAQVWLEVVSENGAGCSVLIEDGAVVERNAVPTQQDEQPEEAPVEVDRE